MTLNEGLFRALRRETGRLAEVGLDREVLEPARKIVAGLGSADLKHRADSELAQAIVADLWDPPRLGGLHRGQRRSGHGHVDRTRLGSPEGIPMLESIRVPLRWAVTGNADWLWSWPDATEQPSVDEIFPHPDLDREEHRREWNRLAELAGNLFLLDGQTVRSFIEVPIELEGSTDPAAAILDAIRARDELLRGYVDAIERTANAQRARIESELTEVIARRRAELGWLEAVDESLTLIPELISVAEEPSEPPTTTTNARALDVLPEINEASFEAIVDQILRWRDRVELYPGSFAKLGEDACSDLLATSLAMIFKVAEREVFVHGGRSDIYIPLAALHPQSPDTPDTFYFYAEAKQGSGKRLAEQALDQADGYRALRVRRAVLLFYVTADDLVAASERTLGAFRHHGDWREEDLGRRDKMLYQFSTDRDRLGRLTVTVVFIHTPRRPAERV